MLIVFDSLAGLLFVEVELSEVGIPREFRGIVVNAVIDDIGEAFFLKLTDQIDLFFDVFGSLRQVIWRRKVEPRERIGEVITVEFSNIPSGLSFATGALFELVLAFVGVTCKVPNIGDVHNPLRLVASEFERSNKGVIANKGKPVAYMRIVVNRRATSVDSHFWLAEWLNVVNRSVEGIVQFHVYSLELSYSVRILSTAPMRSCLTSS